MKKLPDKSRKKTIEISKLKDYIAEYGCRVVCSSRIHCNGMTVKVTDGYVILINESLCYRKRLETIKHELCHILLGHLDDRCELKDEQKEIEVYNHMNKEVDRDKDK